MDGRQLVFEVQARLGGTTERDALTAIAATLRALSEHMQPVDRGAVASALPPPFAEMLEEGGDRGPYDLRSFCERVAALARVSTPFAARHAAAVCRTLMGHLDEQQRAHLALALWPQLLRPATWLWGARLGSPSPSGEPKKPRASSPGAQSRRFSGRHP